MESLVFSLSSPLIDVERSAGDDGKIYVIVPRAHAYLADLLARVFQGRGEVVMIVDRRQNERRSERQPVAVERRGRDRRRRKHEFVQVVIGKATASGPVPEESP